LAENDDGSEVLVEFKAGSLERCTSRHGFQSALREELETYQSIVGL